MFGMFITMFFAIVAANLVTYVITLAISCSPKMYGWVANKVIKNVCENIEPKIDEKYSY